LERSWKNRWRCNFKDLGGECKAKTGECALGYQDENRSERFRPVIRTEGYR
jgi:hypothetical protein